MFNTYFIINTFPQLLTLLRGYDGPELKMTCSQQKYRDKFIAVRPQGWRSSGEIKLVDSQLKLLQIRELCKQSMQVALKGEKIRKPGGGFSFETHQCSIV